MVRGGAEVAGRDLGQPPEDGGQPGHRADRLAQAEGIVGAFGSGSGPGDGQPTAGGAVGGEVVGGVLGVIEIDGRGDGLDRGPERLAQQRRRLEDPQFAEVAAPDRFEPGPAPAPVAVDPEALKPPAVDLGPVPLDEAAILGDE